MISFLLPTHHCEFYSSGTVSKNKAFPPKVTIATVFYPSNGKVTNTHSSSILLVSFRCIVPGHLLCIFRVSLSWSRAAKLPCNRNPFTVASQGCLESVTQPMLKRGGCLGFPSYQCCYCLCTSTPPPLYTLDC